MYHRVVAVVAAQDTGKAGGRHSQLLGLRQHGGVLSGREPAQEVSATQLLEWVARGLTGRGVGMT